MPSKFVAFINYNEYDPPRKKMVYSSPNRSDCEKYLVDYLSKEKNKGKWGGVEKVEVQGDPYYKDWS